ncbi:MAG: rrf2 family protein [Candidatus Peregrinibacteria bacterium GW2011_GWC2_39_14]|nr:MAG: Transcriptional regulator, BadM/Rrf2 family [Candidatus Peregrinibacteria bacterium GW2011_GWA2_38_36]KKR07202.1 MAG: rrf2 family protein [Candidatus Peregrinibacteria bacterium GW2011_GWC2_39_14]
MSLFGKLSTKEHHGLRLMMRFAESYKNHEVISLNNISGKEGMSVKYLEQLMIPLKRTKWLQSTRGKAGGYELIKNPKDISIKDVIFLFSGNRAIVDCLPPKNKKCKFSPRCKAKRAWAKVQKTLISTTESIKLSDLIS